MLGVTLGIGSGWNRVAKRAACRMSELTGLDCHVIDSMEGYDFENPVWMKTKIIERFPAEDSFLYFDADIWCVKPWNPLSLFQGCGRKLMAVPEPPHNAIDDECDRNGITRNRYFNAGLMIFGREHKHIFNTASMYHPFGRWFDQTPMNIAFQIHGGYVPLESRYNHLSHGGRIPADLSNIVNVHYCSCGGFEQVEALQKA